MKDTKGLLANHRSDLKILSASKKSPSTDAPCGFPLRATRDSELSIEDLRILICIGILTGGSKSCQEDTRWIARNSELPEPIVTERLDRLGARGYLHRSRVDGAAILTLVPDSVTEERALGGLADEAAPARRVARGAQARLHGDLLRRRTKRPIGSIEFDDPAQPHPVIASLQESEEGQPGGVSGFRFWLKTILDPEDVKVFSEWADRQSAEYRRLIRQFDRAKNDQAIESLLDATLALVSREKSASR